MKILKGGAEFFNAEGHTAMRRPVVALPILWKHLTSLCILPLLNTALDRRTNSESGSRRILL